MKGDGRSHGALDGVRSGAEQLEESVVRVDPDLLDPVDGLHEPAGSVGDGVGYIVFGGAGDREGGGKRDVVPVGLVMDAGHAEDLDRFGYEFLLVFGDDVAHRIEDVAGGLVLYVPDVFEDDCSGGFLRECRLEPVVVADFEVLQAVGPAFGEEPHQLVGELAGALVELGSRILPGLVRVGVPEDADVPHDVDGEDVFVRLEFRDPGSGFELHRIDDSLEGIEKGES